MRSILSRRLVAVSVLGIVLLALAFASAFTPPVFAQFGKHFIGGPSLASVAGVYTCDSPLGVEECEPIKENLVAAIANDPVLANWLPIRFEFLKFE